MTDELLYKIKQVAQRLNVSTSTLYQMVQSGRIEHHRIGCGRGTIRISEAQVQAFLARTERGAVPVPAPATRLRLKHLRL